MTAIVGHVAKLNENKTIKDVNNCLVPSLVLLSPRQVLFMKGEVGVHYIHHDDISYIFA